MLQDFFQFDCGRGGKNPDQSALNYPFLDLWLRTTGGWYYKGGRQEAGETEVPGELG